MALVVAVTGCSSGGIGHALCEEFAERGCIVYATSRNVSTIGDFENKSVKKHALDVTQDEQVQNLVQHVMGAEGRIDIFVNNAGSLWPLADQDIEKVKQAFDTNTYAVLRTAKAVIPEMARRRRGLIVNIGSVVGEIPTPWNGIYCATKAALHSISEVLSMECKPLGISVLHVAPGSVKSNIADNAAERYSIPPDSLYKSYLPNIMYRIYISQGSQSMPTRDFAKAVVTKALRTHPPTYMMSGGFTGLFALLKWLPRTFVLFLVWKLYSREM
ncbi:hypothetical protein AX17_000196 [Amanita inopinata Kibby_2008]|nr:hypothetical protein AX17_000196 [Amanita inopinata Kibby_2008]